MLFCFSAKCLRSYLNSDPKKLINNELRPQCSDTKFRMLLEWNELEWIDAQINHAPRITKNLRQRHNLFALFGTKLLFPAYCMQHTS